MDINDERIKYAVERTEILRPPKRSLSTFGTTNVYYYLLTEPVYNDVFGHTTETVIREGRVVAERPKIVTPYYLSHLDGFGAGAKRYFDMLLREYGASAPGLLYGYRNESRGLNIVALNTLAVADKLNREIDQRSDPMVSIIKGEDELWDVSLMKFIYELTRNSLEHNVMELGSRGLLETDRAGIPAGARARIEELFQHVSLGKAEPAELKTELDRWGVFEEYEDRFLAMFRERA
ncbi:MAG: hypothetical protein V1894_03355 [Chloroflexota bacterium]